MSATADIASLKDPWHPPSLVCHAIQYSVGTGSELVGVDELELDVEALVELEELLDVVVLDPHAPTVTESDVESGKGPMH